MKKSLILISFIFSYTAFANHLLYPDLITVKKHLYDRRYDNVTIPGRTLLRFANGTANIGKGPLEIRKGAVVNGEQTVYQRIYKKAGGYITRYAGTMTYHPDHGHTHFDDYAIYRLREVTSSGGVGEIIATSEKVSFCLYDEYVYNSTLPNFSYFPRYRSCNGTYQGLSVGWKDVYGKNLPGQWIDVTDIADGEYWLESVVDPENKIQESNGSNNSARVKITL